MSPGDMFHCITGEVLPGEMQLEYQTKISGAARGQLKHMDREEAQWDTSNVVLKPQVVDAAEPELDSGDNSDNSDTAEDDEAARQPDELDRQLLELLESTHSSLAEPVPSASVPEVSEVVLPQAGQEGTDVVLEVGQDVAAGDVQNGDVQDGDVQDGDVQAGAGDVQDASELQTAPAPLEESGEESWINVTAEDVQGVAITPSNSASTSATDPDMGLLQDALGNTA